MKNAIIISIVLLLPVTASAYSLLQPETSGIRLSQASFLLAEEQTIEQPAEQPAEPSSPETIQPESSPDLKPGEKPKIFKPRSWNYLLPMIWDLAPIPALMLLASKCSAAKNENEHDECSDKLIKATFIAIPL